MQSHQRSEDAEKIEKATLWHVTQARHRFLTVLRLVETMRREAGLDTIEELRRPSRPTNRGLRIADEALNGLRSLNHVETARSGRDIKGYPLRSHIHDAHDVLSAYASSIDGARVGPGLVVTWPDSTGWDHNETLRVIAWAYGHAITRTDAGGFVAIDSADRNWLDPTAGLNERRTEWRVSFGSPTREGRIERVDDPSD